MNPQQLLTYFDRVNQAPGAVPRLRRFVLDLAVRGKLVDQTPDDEPASALMKKLGVSEPHRIRSVASRPENVVAKADTPFEIPSNWIWVRLGDICSKTGSGSTPRGGKSVYQSDGVAFLRSQNVYDDGLQLDDVAYISHKVHEKMSGTAVRPDDLLLNITGGSIGRCARVPSGFGEANVSQHVAIIRVALDGLQDYLHALIRSPYFQSFVLREQTGAGRGGLPKNRMDRIPVALPPLAEQRRIVAKVGELMMLCDRLEVADTERQGRQDELTTAALHHLDNSKDVEEFRHHVRFSISHLSILTMRVEQISRLRQTILNLAVKGRLSHEDLVEESARAGNTSSVKRAHIHVKENPSVELWPNELPNSWRWHRLEDLSEHITDGEHATPPRIQEQQVPLITAKNVRDGCMDYGNTDWVSHETAIKAWRRCRPTVNDVLLVCVGATTGRLCVLREPRDMVLVRSVALIRPSSAIESDYLAMVLRSPMCQKQIWEKVKVTAQPCLYINRIKSLAIPCPPLAEQQRLIAKVRDLMSLCDRLETQVVIAEDDSCQLLDALLHEALDNETGSRDERRVCNG